jgi:hypothetical protein
VASTLPLFQTTWFTLNCRRCCTRHHASLAPRSQSQSLINRRAVGVLPSHARRVWAKACLTHVGHTVLYVDHDVCIRTENVLYPAVETCSEGSARQIYVAHHQTTFHTRPAPFRALPRRLFVLESCIRRRGRYHSPIGPHPRSAGCDAGTTGVKWGGFQGAEDVGDIYSSYLCCSVCTSSCRSERRRRQCKAQLQLLPVTPRSAVQFADSGDCGTHSHFCTARIRSQGFAGIGIGTLLPQRHTLAESLHFIKLFAIFRGEDWGADFACSWGPLSHGLIFINRRYDVFGIPDTIW